MDNVFKYHDAEGIVGIVIKKDFDLKGVTFFTPESFNLQLGIHVQDEPRRVPPHIHEPIDEAHDIPVQEIFHVLSGKVAVEFYGCDDRLVASVVLTDGDTALLSRGHAVEFLEPTRMIEIRQGPYKGRANDKRFITPKT